MRSRASLFGHPLHPMVVPFPIAFLFGALATDIVFAVTGDAYWPVMSKWLILAALIMGGVAAILGLLDFSSIKEARRGSIGWLHMGGNVTAVLLSLFSLITRWNDPIAAAMPMGITISVIVCAILLVTGWLGGELVFRYRIGVMETQEGTPRESGYRSPHPAE